MLELRRDHPDWSEADLLLAAQRRSDSLFDEAIAAGRDVMVETVLSSPKFEARVLAALEAGYEFGFAFVTVDSDALNVARVRDRVELGGHDVPEDRIRARRLRSTLLRPGLRSAPIWGRSTTTPGWIRCCWPRSPGPTRPGASSRPTRGGTRWVLRSRLRGGLGMLDPPRLPSA